MNNYKLEDIKLNMTGDINPMHSNKQFALNKGFNDKLVFGMLTASFFSTLVGVYLPGENCLFQECKDIKFHSPVFVGDTLKIKGEVIEIDDRFKRITIKVTIRNQNEKKVCSAKLIAGITN